MNTNKYPLLKYIFDRDVLTMPLISLMISLLITPLTATYLITTPLMSTPFADSFIPRAFLDSETALQVYREECKVNTSYWWQTIDCHIKVI